MPILESLPSQLPRAGVTCGYHTCSCLFLNVDARDLNFDPHAHVTYDLSTQPSPSPVPLPTLTSGQRAVKSPHPSLPVPTPHPTLTQADPWPSCDPNPLFAFYLIFQTPPSTSKEPEFLLGSLSHSSSMFLCGMSLANIRAVFLQFSS